MDQAPLIVAIVAVVLGGVGLIGGVLGYVQGTTAVARATNARQRAVVAEEEALQARAAAEATVRAAEELAERLRGERDQAPGLVQGVTTGGMPVLRLEAVAPLPEPAQGAAAPTTTAAADLRPSSPARVDEGASVGSTTDETPSEDPSAPQGQGSATDDVAETAAAPSEQPQQPDPEEAGSATVEAPTADERSAAETAAAPRLTAEEPSADGGSPSDEASVEEAHADSDGSTAAAPPASGEDAGAADEDRPASSSTDGDGEEGPSAEARPEDAIGGPAVPAAAQRGEPDDAAATDEAAPDEGAARDERGRVVAGNQDAPTMDWAEVLRTGAIPLPSISRGTYAAPRRRPRPTGEGPARFELRAIGRQRFEAVNVGGEVAEDARIEGGGDDPHLIRPLSSRSAAVQPAGTLAFSVLRVEGRRASVAVVWMHAGEPVRQELPLD